MRIKDEYLDITIGCPATKQPIVCRFIDRKLYDYYYNNGYSIIFEKEEEITDDIPTDGI